MWAVVFGMWASSPVLGATTEPAEGRVSLTGYGSWAVLPAAPTILPPATSMVMACGGGGFTFVPERKELRGRRRSRRWEVLPSHQRFVVRLFDVCGGLGSDTTFLAPLQGGYGGQWGGRVVYVAAQLEGGLGNLHRDQRPGWINDFGLTLKPRLALGAQLGPVGVEVGPTARVLAPWLRQVRNSSTSGGLMAAGSIDVEVSLGSGVGPKRWYP